MVIPKLMTGREMELFRMALRYGRAYHDAANPHDFPNSMTYVNNEQICREMQGELTFQLDPDDVAECCEEVGGV